MKSGFPQLIFLVCELGKIKTEIVFLQNTVITPELWIMLLNVLYMICPLMPFPLSIQLSSQCNQLLFFHTIKE